MKAVLWHRQVYEHCVSLHGNIFLNIDSIHRPQITAVYTERILPPKHPVLSNIWAFGLASSAFRTMKFFKSQLIGVFLALGISICAARLGDQYTDGELHLRDILDEDAFLYARDEFDDSTIFHARDELDDLQTMVNLRRSPLEDSLEEHGFLVKRVTCKWCGVREAMSKRDICTSCATIIDPHGNGGKCAFKGCKKNAKKSMPYCSSHISPKSRGWKSNGWNLVGGNQIVEIWSYTEET